MTGKTDKYILKPEAQEDLPYHDLRKIQETLGIGYRYIGRAMLPDADMTVHLRYIKEVPDNLPVYVEPHRHDVSSSYCIVGQLTIEVILEGERHEVAGPASVFIPAGMLHSVRPLSGSGYLIIIVRSGQYP